MIRKFYNFRKSIYKKFQGKKEKLGKLIYFDYKIITIKAIKINLLKEGYQFINHYNAI